ncbi:GDSL-type esterase/lipase family protein [Streptomyces sp. DSM 44917]|uniref:GDSL-type esterase/lipase family protein n=1 Tax=Streptomyces boetiae TaxID=3075541 RepID=A0ABU2LE10_9ACTN|nr:ricin-type beta-trefoil lectin domain protein [Streptomyces sp. DSM 44917]MDT0309732.1 GDSL-type esterase/lipase family protein [Streptomyces sp. DSM 44917]
MRPQARAAALLLAAFSLLAGLLALGPTPASGSPGPAPLPAGLEAIRAAEAAELYGDPAVRPLADRRTGIISLGDSEISGEGIGTYEPPTDGPDNWCHRSPDAAIHRTGIPAEVTYNAACSGAATRNILRDGAPQYADELLQSDRLAIAARNTRLDTVLLVVGANDDLQFSSVMTDCVLGWFLFWEGPCAGDYAPGWQARVDALRPRVEATVGDVRAVMREAGYADGSYNLVLMSYPSPIGPDFRDNPRFPGQLAGGCTGHTSDAAWGRNAAVPAFQEGIRDAARNTGATYLDASRLFHGHEVCMEDTWVAGLTVDLLNPFPPDSNSVRQSFHPNYRGHTAFAACLTRLDASGLSEASCADPTGTGAIRLYPGAWDDSFAPLRNAATGTCLALPGDATRDGTAVSGARCDERRNQGWWREPRLGTVYTELTHDRCLTASGEAVTVANCTGRASQRFTLTTAGTLTPTADPGRCATLASPAAPLTLRPCDGSPRQRFS